MPTEPARLDPREARPLTSREISKVICAIIGGVVTVNPGVKPRVPTVLELARKETPIASPLPSGAQFGVSWEVALMATVAGFRGWCDPKDVDTAIEWVDQNLPLILGKLTEKTKLPS